MKGTLEWEGNSVCNWEKDLSLQISLGIFTEINKLTVGTVGMGSELQK